MVVVVGPDRHAGLGATHARTDPPSAEPAAQRRGGVLEAGLVERLVQRRGCSPSCT
jgi:hypothetical protein